VVATGSSSYHLRARTRESLAGRATRTLLYPYGVNEVAGAEAGSTPAHRRPSRLRELVEEMTVFGGYPQVWQAVAARAKQTVLLNMVESLVLRDASDCFHIRHPQAFRTILRLAATKAGNLLNLSEWAALAGISVGTVSDYVSILEESHIVRLLPPFLGGRRAEITSTPKVFFLDNGIRNLLHGGFEPFAARGDRGLVLENFVFTEVVKALGPLDEVAFWRTKNRAEVDFVVRRGDRLVPVEVKAAETARLNVPRALHSFLGAYRPPAALMVTPAIQGTEVVGETRVEFVAPEGVRAAVQRLLSSD
jgi:predicted AAA+ superfamily ATPase